MLEQRLSVSANTVATTLLATTVLLVTGSILPARAEADGNSSKPELKTSSSKGAPVRAGERPLKVLGFLAGTVGGTPVCLVKRLANDEVEGTRALVGKSRSLFLLVPAGVFWLPFAGIAGVLEAPFYSMQNSIVSKPFSKEQFSLGNVDTKE